MLMCTVFFIHIVCNVVTSKDITPTHQIKIQFPQPTISTYTYPYQEDLISTVQFLKEESSTKKSKVSTLIKLLKKILNKYEDVLRDNYEKNKHHSSVSKVENLQEITNEIIKENNTILEEKERISSKEIDKDNMILREGKTENIVKEVYEIGRNTFDPQNALESAVNNIPEGIIDTSIISVTDFIEDDPMICMHNFRSKPICYRNQQDSYVLERPEPKIVEVDLQPEKVIKFSNPERNRNTVMKNSKNKKIKKEPFSIPCVKASDILDETPRYVPKEAYKNSPQVKLNCNVQESTLESPVSNYLTICSESDDTVAMLFKPKTISLMQAYGNLLKKITVTVLVPFHVTKLVL